MRSKVLRFITENSLISRGDSIIVALSGGADSVSLFHFLISIRDELDLKIYAFHLNHMIRGESAERDMHFAEKLCERYDVDITIERSNIPEISKRDRISEETAGRTERYRYFRELSYKYGAKVATAHTMSDNAETVLFNLSRGSSLKGASGIPLKRDFLIRPLLCVNREEIERYCAENGLDYVTDETNFEDEYSRNRIRHKAIPVFRDLNPDFENSISRFSQRCAKIQEYMEKEAEKAASLCKKGYGYDSSALLLLDEVILEETLAHILRENGVGFENVHIKLILNALKEQTDVILSGNITASCKQGLFRIFKAENNSDFEVFLYAFDGVRLLERADIDRMSKKERNDLIDCAKITDSTVIRHRREGDVFRLPRRNITKSLKKLFNEEKIPAELRDRLLIVSDGSNILWCEGIGASEFGKTDINTKSAVMIAEGVQKW